MNELKSRIAYNLRRMRTSKDYTLEYVADHIGKGHYSSYQRIELGQNDLKVEDAVKLANLYKTTVESIINPSEDSDTATFNEPGYPYGRKNSLNLNVILDGREDTLQKHIELLTKVNVMLAEI